VSKSSASRKQSYAFYVLPIVAVVAIGLIVLTPAQRWQAHGTSPHPLVSAVSPSKAIAPTAQDRLRASYAALPLAFEQNVGQTDSQVQYMARANGYKLYLTSSQAIFTVHKRGAYSEVQRMVEDRRIGPAAVKKMLRRRAQEKSKNLVAAVRMQMLGANPNTQLAAQAPQAGKINYFIGKDTSKWHSNVPLFEQVRYENLYPGINLAFHGNNRQTEFDYLVSPGADAGRIALGFDGAQKVSVTAAGDLLLTTQAGPLEIHKPVAYQEKNGMRKVVEAAFQIDRSNRVKFALGAYDHGRELVIDPTVTYSTYFGGDFADYGLSIAVDASGNEYVAGATDSDTIPGDSSGTNAASVDVFVTKISSAGVLQFTTLLGGSGQDYPGGIAVDSAGIYLSGTTDSSDFPVTAGVVQPLFLGGVSNGDNDAFAANLALNGSSINWATYIGGSDSDSGYAVAVDSGHNVYVVGETFSSDLGGAVGGVNPLPNGSAVNLGLGTGADDGYIVKLNSTGTAYDLVSYLGGSNGDLATGVALDPAGNIYISGETISTDLPTTPSNVVQPQCGTDGQCNASDGNVFDDAFVVGIPAALGSYTYLTYYGGSNVDDALGIAVDSNGDAFITGNTASTDFKTVGTAFQASLQGAQNAFAVELNPTGTAATYGTYLGGNGTDFGLGITLDVFGNVYVTGQTSSSNFPLQNPTQSGLSGNTNTDAFVTVLSPSQALALFSTYLGGGGDEDQLGGAVALDSSSNIYITGDTDSGNGSTSAFPTLNPVTGGSTYGGGTCVNSDGASVPCPDAFITAYSTATVPDFAMSATTATAVSPGTPATSTVTLTSLNAYASLVNLTCGVTGGGSPAPTCSLSPTSATPANPGTTSTLTIATTGSSAALAHPAKFFYAMWLPITGMSLIGMAFSSARSRRKKLLGFLMVFVVMAALFLMPACGGGNSSGGGGGGGGGSTCSGCTPAGSYTVTVTGVGSDTASTTHTAIVTLTVN